MFTGIVEETGHVLNISRGNLSAVLTISADVVLRDVHMGDSICVNGVCLTVTGFGRDYFTADVMGETLRRSSLGKLSKGSRVNLERAMAAGGRFGGHIVSGHIDGCGTISNIKKESTAHWFTISADANLLKYIVEKGSIAIDGISLTVAAVSDKDFKVSIIPHTSTNTTLLDKKSGDIVNLECDIIGKYVEKLMCFGGTQNQDNLNSGSIENESGLHNNTGGLHNSSLNAANTSSNIDMEFLAKNGFL